jgi:pyruvate dehydrogenase E2 component (dihydrolipoamide acetyltransferase)/2-oxoisovalerate dehydrogenase E2 component (dihydrolipoyl transacylase)
MDFQVPELGEGVYEAEFLDWKVKVGDAVRRGQILMEVLTDKATMEIPAPFAGTIIALRAEPGQKIKVGDRILSYTPAGEPAGKEAAAPAEPAPKEVGPLAAAVPESARRNGPTVPASHPDMLVKAAPSVRLMARKMGIDLARVHGSGPQGRILIDDLSAALAATGAARLAPAVPRADYGVAGSRIKLQGLRRRIAERMVQSKQTIPHYAYVDECDVTALVALRDSLREPFDRAGIKLTYLPFFVKAAVRALKEVPIVNASLDEAAGEIVLRDHYHVGIAVATPGGLIVPVVQDADKKDLVQIARDVERLSADARAGKSRREDLRGGTFTITSIGGIGGLISTPIINPPEVAIVGVGKIVKRPVFDDAGLLKPADLVYLSFSFDHRVLDGAVGAAFGNALIRHLLRPAALLLPDKLGG